MIKRFISITSILTTIAILLVTILVSPLSVHAAATINSVETQGAEFNFLKSDKFEVRVSGDNGSTWKNSFVYKTTYNIVSTDPIYESGRTSDTISYTDFSSNYSQSVKVEVKLLTGNINSVVIRPSDYGIGYTTVNSNTITFNLSTARKVSVEINENGSGYITHKLFIFGNALETGVPDPLGANVYKFTPGGSLGSRIDFSQAWGAGKDTAYFPKGLYYITEDSLIPSGKTVYLEPGAYVFGSFMSVDPTWQTTYDNITVKGRGILDSFYGNASQIWLQGSNNNVEGVMLLNKYKGPNTPSSGVSVSAVWIGNGSVRNTKVIDWMHAGGIFGLWGTFIVDDCFIFTNDDCIDISFPERSIITNNITWNYYNGSALCFSWNSTRSPHMAYVNNLDVIHWDSKFDDPGDTDAGCSSPYDDRTGAKMAVFFASHDSDVPLKNFQIENVRVERMSSDSLRRFVSLCVYDNQYCVNGTPAVAYHGRSEFGGLEDIMFKDITIDGTTTGNVLHGYDSDDMVKNVTFDNLKINGSVATSLSDASISVNSYTSDIKFIEQNKINNYSFEADAGFKDTPTGWSSTGDVSADYSYGPGFGSIGDNSGTHYNASSAYNVTTYQTATSLTNGIYAATAWIQSTGGQTTAVFRASDFGGTTIDTTIPTSSNWSQVQIPVIVVSNGQCKLSFVSNASAGQFIRFDNVQLYKLGMNFMNQLYTGSRNDLTGQVGYKFRPNSNITVTALGRPGTGMSWSHGIKIFRVSDSAYITGTTVTTSSKTDHLGYKFETLSTPVTLSSGVDYYITSTESSGADTWMDWGTISNHRTNATILGSIWDSSLTNCPSSGNFGAGTDKGYCAPVFYTSN